jgi:hypothetical protein
MGVSPLTRFVLGYRGKFTASAALIALTMAVLILL